MLLPLRIPNQEFFLILNQTVHNGTQPASPYGFAPQAHVIDYVRVFAACTLPEEFCPTGGFFDGQTGLCAPQPGTGLGRSYPSPCRYRKALSPSSAQNTLFLPCTDPCPHGGYFDGANCSMMRVPQPATDCTTTGGVRCGKAFIHLVGSDAWLYFTPLVPSPVGNPLVCTERLQDGLTGAWVDVPMGYFDGANCQVSKGAAGVHYWPYFDDTVVYYTPACRP